VILGPSFLEGSSSPKRLGSFLSAPRRAYVVDSICGFFPMQTVHGSFVINTLIVEQWHRVDPASQLEKVYRAANGLIVLCTS
jgi:hypothetical protein